MLYPGAQKFIDRKCLAEMIKQQAADVVMGKTDRADEDAGTGIITPRGRRHCDRFLIERFGVEKQPVHVEDDRGRAEGKLHPLAANPTGPSRRPAERSRRPRPAPASLGGRSPTAC